MRYNLIMYLQRRNPNVPGIAEKLDVPRKRQMNLVIQYWKKIIEIKPVDEIYLNQPLTSQNISIDHFVPGLMWHIMNFGTYIQQQRELTAKKGITCRTGTYIFRRYVEQNIFLII